MGSKVGENSARKFSVQELLEEAKVLEFSCTLSTKEEERSRKATLTLFTEETGKDGDTKYNQKWYLSGHPLTRTSSSPLSTKFFAVDNPLQLLFALSTNVFPQLIHITQNEYKLKMPLYIQHIDECVVKEMKNCSKNAE